MHPKSSDEAAPASPKSTEIAPRGATVASRFSKRIQRVTGVAALALGLTLASLAVVLFSGELPGELGTVERRGSLVVRDRHERVLVEVTKKGERRQFVRAADISPPLRDALLAAEDARFYSHFGIDPIAMARAFKDALFARRIVSGASTLTQQLARAHFERPRNLYGKLREIGVALRIERRYSKDEILTAYLNDVSFSANTRGIFAASRALFDKAPRSLDLSEAALLVGLARGPGLYDPSRRPELAKRRRDRVLDRMLDRGMIGPEDHARAVATPVVLQHPFRSGHAEHFARALALGKLGEGIPSGGSVTSSIDETLQREAESLVEETLSTLGDVDASAASAIVIDNASGEILAYVGSRSFWDAASFGQNDGVLAQRQPGSALKPFLYLGAIERLGYTPATLLPDTELHVQTPRGDYSPKNYDGKFHGPVRLRHALANSLNVPAVATILRLGPENFLDRLHDFGFASLGKSSDHYGAALALGDGEVSLLELTRAYASLARGGESVSLSPFHPAPEVPARRLSNRESTALLASILSDDAARESAFGRENSLEFAFPVAVKTGTSKGYRDNWSVGYSSAITIGVWVGNFDGHPMRGISGVTGAAPLFRKLMHAAMRGRIGEALPGTASLVHAEICPLSGKLRGPECAHGQSEEFLRGTVPRDVCDMHVRVLVSERGLLADDDCMVPKSAISVERYTEPYLEWAKNAGRPLGPLEADPRCAVVSTKTPPRILYPLDGAKFSIDPSLPLEKQSVRLKVSGGTGVVLEIDGKRVPLEVGTARFALREGRHSAIVRSPDGATHSISFSVR